ncbi:DNA primase family protein [Crossiella sp. CA198]|uniref:DNA primase family protein n=1 Tax=Crossiella sp. CA198 TaxID=3455607 RepID=UPI003F8D4210
MPGYGNPDYDDQQWAEADGTVHAGLADTQPVPEMHRGQLRMAERLAARHGGRLLHAHNMGWYLWDGQRWAPDRDGAAMRAAIDTVKAALHELTHLDGSDRSALNGDIRKSESASGLEGMLRIAEALTTFAVSADQLDADPYLFNTADGTLDLRTGEIRPHAPADRITKVAGCGLGEEHGEAFPRFLAEILPDADVRGFAQRLFGYAMLGTVREHVLPIFTGTGQNGKSTLLNVVGEAFGDYAIAAEPEMLVDRGNTHPTGQADLLGVRLAMTSETDEGRQLAAATVKRLTGGDKIRARRMRKDFFEFEPSHTIVLVTNFKPKVSGDDPALWRRIRVVPFDVVVEQIDTRLSERLALELPSVLGWAYAGYREYTATGLAAPEVVAERTAAYRASSDALGRFLDDRAIITPHGFVRARELFRAWSDWCHQNGEQAGSEVTFADAMARRGHTKTRRSIGQVYLGLILQEAEDDAA